MEEIEISKKAAKRRRQRAKRKDKIRDSKPIFGEMESQQEKSKEQILAERKAKKAAKKQGNKKEETPIVPPLAAAVSAHSLLPTKTENQSTSVNVDKEIKDVQSEKPKEAEKKSREEVLAERETKKLAKQAGKKKNVEVAKDDENKQQSKPKEVEKTNSDTDLAQKMEKLHITNKENEKENKPQTPDDKNPEKGKPMTKAERRALQEAQRAAKAKLMAEKNKPTTSSTGSSTEKKIMIDKKETKTKETSHKTASIISQKSSSLHKVRLFKHLYTEKCNFNIKVNSSFHPAILKLGAQYANNAVVGCNSRCYAFLRAMQILIKDFTTPSEKVFYRALESEIQKSVEFLHKCRPLAVSVSNALKYIKLIISQENSSDSDDEKKGRIIDKIETYAHEQIETAARSISLKVREKISDDDVILTFGYSSLIKRTLVESWKSGEKKFSIIVVDSRPDFEGREMLDSLAKEGICCTYVFINATSFVMPKVTKVLLGAHALLANGYVMSRVGTAQISMIASFYNVPVLVCCETHKFSERVQTDSFVYNEIGDPNALVVNKNSMKPYEHLKDWESIPHLTPLNLRYDITPPELVTAVVTEIALLPCTSVQVILRVKPSE
ncbi:hypothetical protein PVAND_008931 [Polypedilum vanderplanki]|uniref:Translation initiation factor eIF2B subunit delta n=1 Tax=Polypedilum vanderplanki TaxID=319348 RepID=A0A9J6CB43_POLVA|nr:hypothetical protein PVAND_008931 [Polypedilum vanderplanki]